MVIFAVTILKDTLPTIRFSQITVNGSYAASVLLPGILMAIGLGMAIVPLTASVAPRAA